MISCPGCGAGLRFDIRSQLMKCDHCDGTYDPYLFADTEEDAERVYLPEDGGLEETGTPGKASNAKRPTKKQKKAMKAKAALQAEEQARENWINNFTEDAAMDMAAYRCPQCGAELYTADKTDITAVCSYCGGANILFDRMCRMRCPDYIIPFKLTKEDCVEQYRKETRRSFFTPRYMKTKTVADSFRAIYMPYWSFDIRQKGKTAIEGIGRSYREGDYSCKNYYDYTGYIDTTYRGIAHDASRAFDDGISECLAPFDLTDRVPFTPAFLSGFYADAPDVDPRKMEDDAVEFAKKSTVEAILKNEKEADDKERFSDMHRGDTAEAEVPHEVTERAEVFYPVWFMSVRRGNRISYAAINGQTGKVAADLPISPVKFMIFSLLLAALAFAVLNVFSVLKPGWALAVMLILMAVGLVLNGEVYRRLKEKLGDTRGGEILDISKAFSAENSLSNRMKIFLMIAFVLWAAGMGFAFSKIPKGVLIIWLVILSIFLIGEPSERIKKIKQKKEEKRNAKANSGKQETANDPDRGWYRLFLYVGIAEIIIGIIIIIANPVVNRIFYIYSFIVAGTFLLMIFFILRIHAKLAARRPPQFNKTGGDDNA